MQNLDRQRSGQLKSMVTNRLCASIGLQDPTGNTYAGKGPCPRPMPKWSFSDFRERKQRFTRKLENVLSFAFLNERLSPESPIEIPSSAETMWCLVRPGDDVLLSDRVIHHYMGVESIDHTADSIRLIDPWPNDCFLLENRNEAGVAAQLLGTSIIITKAEFLRVITGVLTIDLPDFVDDFLALEPINIGTPALHIALGSSLLFNGNDAYVRNSIRHLRRALHVAEEQHDDQLAKSAAHKLHLALTLLSYIEEPLADDDLAQLSSIESRYPENERFDLSTSEDYFRIGLAAGRAFDFEKSAAALSLALAKDPHYEDAYTYRALDRQQLGQLPDALDDTTKALLANEQSTKNIQRRTQLPENKSVFREAELMDEFAYSVEKRAKIFHLRAQIERDAGNTTNSLTDAQESDRLHEQVAAFRAMPQKT